MRVGFVELPSLIGPALVRVERVILVRPHHDDRARTLVVLDAGQELIVPRPAAEVVSLLAG
jgi:hypothetical protein